MNKAIKLKHIMPELLPQGWKKEVAKMMGVHRNTVTNALRHGSGDTYNRVMHCARIKYGTIVEVKS